MMSEECFRAIFNRAAVGIAIVKPDGCLLDCNAAYEQILGYTKAELRRMHFADITHPDFVEKNLALQRQLAEGQIDKYQIEKQYIRKDGQAVWCRINSSAVHGEDGVFKYSIVIIEDIDERMRARQALCESEEKYRLFVQYSRDIVLFIRRDGQIVEANQAAVGTYGYSRKELLAMKIHDLRSPGARHLVDGQLEAGFKKGLLFESTHRRKDGTEFPVEVSTRGAVMKGQEVLLSIVRDITRRKQAEEEREISVEFLRLMNESRNTGDLIRATAAFFQEKSGCEAVGIRIREGDDYPYYEARGFRPGFIRKENQLCNRDKQGRVIRDGEGFPVLDCMCGNVITGRSDPAQPFFTPRGSFWTNSTTELLASTTEKDRLAKTRNVCNTEGYESFALIALRAGDERLGVLQLNDRRKGHFTLERIKMWERLADHLAVALAKFRAEAAMQEARARAELYLDLMGHDMNNMHQIALGYLEMARDLYPEIRQQEFLEKPIEVLQRSARLIQNVRKLQKLHDGLFRTEKIDLSAVLVGVQKEFDTAPDKKITLNLKGRGHCHIMANELLHDVFANLVSNAIKHTGNSADIAMTMDRIKDHDSWFCRVTVEDNGPGIPDDFKGIIFKRALKGTARAKGMGLGLYLVKSLVESYGGHVWAEDRVKGDHTKGARFVVMLPAIQY